MEVEIICSIYHFKLYFCSRSRYVTQIRYIYFDFYSYIKYPISNQ